MKEKIQNVCEKLLTSIRKNAIILQTNKQTNKQRYVCQKLHERRAIIGLIALRTLGNGGVCV